MEVLALSAISAVSDSTVSQARQLRAGLCSLSDLLASARQKRIAADFNQADLMFELRKLKPEIEKWILPE